MSDDGLSLPDGFDDAPEPVQQALLETYSGADLVGGICELLDAEPPGSAQLRRRHKAAIYLRLRDTATGDGEIIVAPSDPDTPDTIAAAVDGETALEPDDADTDPGPDDETYRCAYCGDTFDTENGKRIHQGRSCRPDWLHDDPDIVLADAPTSRTLYEIIKAVVSEDDIMGVHTRLDSTSIGQARGGILGPLGLVGPDGDLVDGDTLDERLSVLSAFTIDEAAEGGDGA